MTSERYRTIQEVAEYCEQAYPGLGITVGRLRLAMKNGQIEFVDFAPPNTKKSNSSGKRHARRFSEPAIAAWIKSLTQGISQNETTCF